MKDFFTPEITEVTELSEGIFADSMSGTPTKPPITNTPPDIEITKRWSNHDSGHFSCAHIQIKNGNKERNGFTVIVSFGLPITRVDGISFPFGESANSTNMTQSGGTFTFHFKNHVNPNETIGLSFNNIYFKNTSHARCDDGVESCSYDHRRGENLNVQASDSDMSVDFF